MIAPSTPSLDYSRHYAKFHPDNPAHREGLRRFHDRVIVPHLPADRATPVLDVGCGRGYALQHLATLGYTQLMGIDIDAGQVAYAQAQGSTVTLTTDATGFLAGRPASFGVILLMDVLEHVPRSEQPALLRAAHASLRPGGRLICTVPNASSSIASHWLYFDYTHHGSFTVGSLEFILEDAGFIVRSCSGAEVLMRPRFLFWLPISRSIAWWLRCLARAGRRLTYVGELGWEVGWRIPLAPNLLVVADRH